MVFDKPFRKRVRKQRNCLHHNPHTGESWCGRVEGKGYYCLRCAKVFFIMRIV